VLSRGCKVLPVAAATTVGDVRAWWRHAIGRRNLHSAQPRTCEIALYFGELDFHRFVR